MIDLEPAAREVVRLLDGMSDGDLHNPTPCPDFSVAALLDHIMGLSLAFTLAARKAAPPEGFESRPGLGTAEHLDPAWRDVLPQRLDGLAAAWRDPAAWLGTAEAGGVSLPAEVMAVAALDELVLHGWDLARATDQKFTCDPASVQAVLHFTEASARPEQAGMRGGLFGPVVEVPEDASAFERALGYAGRDPRWTRDSA
ncbi:TIGR03086 family metal-binding protein [Catellatospora tritici]|uniref:TIGR03086 family metal-binding protein n=1 Tax=Catellatospora tritici TaxID=2851566 RepID=UPI001C2D37B9|nr:TIGR03086 family metal-binding protein [Catellatospora tritici]MBV1852856.1 TIGR03086 family protein [Catellatospora tritici]